MRDFKNENAILRFCASLKIESPTVYEKTQTKGLKEKKAPSMIRKYRLLRFFVRGETQTETKLEANKKKQIFMKFSQNWLIKFSFSVHSGCEKNQMTRKNIGFILRLRKRKKHSPCCVDRLLLDVTVIDGVDAVFKFAASCEFASPESCRDREKRRFNPKLATPLETFATRELKKLIFQLWKTNNGGSQ